MTRVFTPTSLEEAVHLLGDGDLRPTPVAGCTDLLVVDHAAQRRHRAVVDLLRVPELAGIVEDGDFVDIGACCTFTEIRQHPLVKDAVPLLTEAAATVGGWQIQNRATLGGNVANASPAGDSLPVLLALDAGLVLASSRGLRGLPYEEMHIGYRETALQPGEVIARVRLPKVRTGQVHRFKKVGTREAQAISKVVMAFSARLDGDRLHEVRVAAGSVAATPVRLAQAETALEGQVVSASLAEAVAVAARAEVNPIDDVRSTAAYRRHVTGAILRRVVLDLVRDAAS